MVHGKVVMSGTQIVLDYDLHTDWLIGLRWPT
jgi:hypothetical protein